MPVIRTQLGRLIRLVEWRRRQRPHLHTGAQSLVDSFDGLFNRLTS